MLILGAGTILVVCFGGAIEVVVVALPAVPALVAVALPVLDPSVVLADVLDVEVSSVVEPEPDE